MKAEQANFQFVNLVVKESHLVFNKIGDYEIDIHFSPKGLVMKSINQFVLFLKVEIGSADDGCRIEILTESTFIYPNGSDIEEYKKSFFIKNAPAIVFPYIRAYISGLTALSGMPTLTLPTLNLSVIGENLSKNIDVQE